LSTSDDTGQWPAFSEPGGAGVSPQRRAWRAMYKTYWAIVPLMDRDLRHDADMDLATYNALVHTHLAGPNGIRMKDMAKNASLSTSGLTALVDRLERKGLVQRNPDPHDRRATRITLTDDGLERARQAAHVHVASIERHFASRLTERDATALAETLERIEHDVNTSPHGPEARQATNDAADRARTV
jgi:DNA-binding MarR family transcriptional regulator